MSDTSRALKTTIITFSVLILLLFIIISTISILQYAKYKIVDGTAICGEFVDRCVLSFPYLDPENRVQSKISTTSFHDIRQSGVFRVQVAYQPPKERNQEPTDFFIVGSPNHVFLGTKSMMLIYLTLTILAFFICVSYMPF